MFIAKLEKLVQLCEPVIGAAVWHVIPDRVADLLEGEQLAHNRQLEWPVVVLNHNQINGKQSLDRISLDRNCHFSLDRKF